ncbi:uncharacterized protein B0H18DRAFT_1008747 [Fomitopsis serialis]|uniref:uncharacterized protein n=1 Tax=Fomitopsis serialis TaxID=139415 RepID=UPI0020073E41|nr:uncharacterized protein B0H18DRAFT_1008747 [Neoantrodia serialis]KAH9925499.1 hypothetical protein B0H18DRAFT_1008747 [Neoantrodia serialis]
MESDPTAPSSKPDPSWRPRPHPWHVPSPRGLCARPPQSSFNFPSMYSATGGEYALPPTSSLYPAGYANAADASANPGLTLPAGASPELVARYRAQAELLSRAGVLPHQSALSLNGGHPAANTDGGVLPSHTLYNDPQAQQARYNGYSVPMPAASDWAQDTQPQHSFHALDGHRKDYGSNYAGGRESFPARDNNISSGAGEPSLQTHPPAYGSAFPSLSSGSGNANGYHGANVYHPRSENLSEDFNSDGGSTHHSHSLPGSAQSSNVHLPLPDQSQARQSYILPGFTHLDSANHDDRDDGSSNDPDSHHNSSKQNGHVYEHEGQGEGGFSSAFGLMSLDDPNVLAGLASDSAPFFSNLTPGASGLNLQTPTQDMIAALKTGRSDGDSKEMRDFWKMYLRTPLSGPGSSNGMPLATPTGPGQILGAGRPSPTRRHSRVTSLPSIKTPTTLPDWSSNMFPASGRDMSRAQRGHEDGRGGQQRNEGNPGVFSSMRTTLHDADDLRSYEQAVLARKAPMNLNLVPKRRGTMPAGTAPPNGLQPQHSQEGSDSSKATSLSPNIPHLPQLPPSNKIPDLLNRPSSSTSTNSSLAYAFGAKEGQMPPPPHGSRPSSQSGPLLQPQAMRPPSGGSTSTTAVGSDAGTDSDSSYRPSFKRLASQTLGPENTKRALLGPAGWDDDGVDDEDDEDGDFGQRSLSVGADEGAGAPHTNNVPAQDLPPLGRMEQSAAPS